MRDDQVLCPNCDRRMVPQCGAVKLYDQLESLSDIIEQLGGRTEFTVRRANVRATSIGEVSHVGG